jgi:predicted ATP-binding protein involved in virulence
LLGLTQEDEVLKFGKDKALYNAFVNTITELVGEWQDIKFSWYLDDLIGKTADGTYLPYSHLSDGYRSIIALAAEIAYRAIKLNPQFGANAVKKTKGIVLIDEIDMHLHPKWQGRIVGDLKRVFPNIQFIATIHSPFIVQSLKANEIINLDGEISDDPIKKSIEEITEDEMGVDNVRRSKKITEYQKVAAEYFYC